MSTCYYLIETNKKKEFDKLENFWENILFENTKKTIEQFFKDNKGCLINDDLLDEILDSNPISSLKYCPVDDDSFSVRLGTSTVNGFYWDYVSLNLGSVAINDFKSLEAFLKENPEYSIWDEYNTPISLEEFKMISEKAKAGKKR